MVQWFCIQSYYRTRRNFSITGVPVPTFAASPQATPPGLCYWQCLSVVTKLCSTAYVDCSLVSVSSSMRYEAGINENTLCEHESSKPNQAESVKIISKSAKSSSIGLEILSPQRSSTPQRLALRRDHKKVALSTVGTVSQVLRRNSIANSDLWLVTICASLVPIAACDAYWWLLMGFTMWFHGLDFSWYCMVWHNQSLPWRAFLASRSHAWMLDLRRPSISTGAVWAF